MVSTLITPNNGKAIVPPSETLTVLFLSWSISGTEIHNRSPGPRVKFSEESAAPSTIRVFHKDSSFDVLSGLSIARVGLESTLAGPVAANDEAALGISGPLLSAADCCGPAPAQPKATALTDNTNITMTWLLIADI